MATQAAYKRLAKEFKDMTTSPPPLMCAKPLESNILEWHFLFNGPPDTPYVGGVYWGKLVFPAEYPYKPPNIRMITPSGRFKSGQRICLSYSDFHPEQWNPGWSVATILNGLLSFMTSNEGGAGTEQATTVVRRQLASTSMLWNRNQKSFRDIWSEYCQPGDTSIPQLGSPLDLSSSRSSPEPTPTLNPVAESLRHRRQPGRSSSASCASPLSTSTPHTSPSFWRRCPTWLLVLGSLWLCLFFHRLAARLIVA